MFKLRARLGSRCRPSMLRRNRLTFRSRRTPPAPLNSSVRLQERFRVSGKSTPACRPRFASPWFLRSASGWPACFAHGRWGSSSQFARVLVRASIASVARAMCRNVTISQAGCLSHAGPHHLAFLQCVWCGTIVHQRSGFGFRLTVRSRRTAAPPLNSSVRRHGKFGGDRVANPVHVRHPPKRQPNHRAGW